MNMDELPRHLRPSAFIGGQQPLFWQSAWNFVEWASREAPRRHFVLASDAQMEHF
jgi:hypothetical protein